MISLQNKYVAIDDVKKLLKRSGKSQVRFPGGPRSLSVNRAGTHNQRTGYGNTYNTDIVIDQTLIYCSEEYEGSATVHVKFTSPTDYQVNISHIGEAEQRPVADGVGDIASNYVSVDGNFGIDAGAFSAISGGQIIAGDTIDISFEVHYTDERAEFVIATVEGLAEMELNAHGIRVGDLESDSTFAAACAYLSAYQLYVDAFGDQMCADGEKRFLQNWKKMAARMLEAVAKGHKRLNGDVGIVSFQSFVSSIGDKFGEQGISPLTTDLLGASQPIASEDIFTKDRYRRSPGPLDPFRHME